MKTLRIRPLRAAAATCLAAAAAWPALAGDLPPPLLAGSPLVLKDGRMAYVTVQTVPFQAGADALAPDMAEAVAQLAAGLATDCFLTAQAIGHVDPGAKGEGDMLASHRLARDRAEQVQQALADKGLPPAAIANVWDWQFLVREPRVTLWVFQMRAGEDCTGQPLPPPVVAGAAEPAETSSPIRLEVPAATLPIPRGHDAVAETPAAEPPAPEPPPVLAAVEEPPPPEVPAASLADLEPAAEPPASAVPVLEPPAEEAAVTAALPVEEPAPAPAPASPGPGIEIVFDTNSSYFPQGASRELKRWVGSLPPAGGYELEIAAAVDAADVRAADPAQAARYGRWLAERRIGRVAEWLERNVEVRNLRLSQSFLEDDSSRRVVIRARPLP